MDYTIINFYGEQASRCGYCKGTHCSISHGMHAYKMTPTDYQALIDRGWRRSGQYCYKPHNPTTCCPCYTIKCDALEFQLSKSHKKILKRMNRFLRDGKKDKNDDVSQSDGHAENAGEGVLNEPKAPDNVLLPNVDLAKVAALNQGKVINSLADNKVVIEKSDDVMKIENKLLESTEATSTQRDSLDSCNLKPPNKKAKQLRLERRQAKLAAKGIAAEPIKPKLQNNCEKTLAQYIADTSPEDKHKLKIVLVPTTGLKITQDAYDLYRKYQLTIHNDDPQRVTPNSLQRFLYKSPLKLVKSGDGPTSGYGSFHQQYWLDDKLIAVGVIDILPHCLSSVYFFYDPEYSFLSLGTYGSLREIEFVQQLATQVPELKYYYMGFYIHSCPKMRYKGRLVPSYLLCPEAYTWHVLSDEIRSKLDVKKYQRINTELSAKDSDELKEEDLNRVLLLLDTHSFTSYQQYCQITGEEDDDREMILEYGKLVGKPCAHRMLYLKV